MLSLSCFICHIDWVILWCNGISDTPDEEEGFNEIIQVEVQLICDTPFKVFSEIYSGGLLLINVQDDVFLIKYVLINNLLFIAFFPKCLNVLSETCNLKTCNIDNIYIRFGSSVFWQVIGIPMGTNSAPLLADLFLHTLEYDFMVKAMKHDISKTIQFSNTFRYIDDLFSINNVDFGNYISAIYPPKLRALFIDLIDVCI